MILPLQLHSECKRNTPTTAEIWPGQGRKQQEFPAAVVNKSPELFSSCKILLKCSQLLPPVLNLLLQLHSECTKKKTPTTAELQGQGKKHNTLLAASSSSESPTATTFRMQKKKNPTTAELQGQGKKHNTLPTASSSSESPTTNTFRMPKKKTPTIAELQGQGKKHNTLLAASSSSESPTATTFRMQNKKKKKHPQLQNSRDKEKNTTQQVSSCSL
jgi:hypothetical protein